jgi:chemotaxis methyl-accepting protein methylase/signal transduction histidine kinase/PAS domain-containing protein
MQASWGAIRTVLLGACFTFLYVSAHTLSKRDRFMSNTPLDDQSRKLDGPSSQGVPEEGSIARFPIVGLGASAGGLQALKQFFIGMPADSGMAFVVILHLSPQHESHAAAVLQETTKMPVMQVDEVIRVAPNTVYVIPPTKYLEMEDDHIRLSEPEHLKSRLVAIDLFFRTLADAHGTYAIGVVLSGAGTDGSVGIRRVKESGGITIAQDPHEAELDGMPRAAIATGAVDFVLPVNEMPKRLIDVWRNAQQFQLEAASKDPVFEEWPSAEDILRDVFRLLHRRTGYEFYHYKRSAILQQIGRRMQVTATQNLAAYRDYLENHAEEAQVLKDMLFGGTSFYRNSKSFESFERKVVPRLFQDKAKCDKVRVWCAGCSTGEEAYSMAMLLLEYTSALACPPNVQVFATDIDQDVIRTARAGHYPAAIEADVPPRRLRHFFTMEEDGYRIDNEVREHLLFAVHNLMKDPPFSKLDAIICRNLVSCFNRDTEAKVFELFHFALRPGGYLFLGLPESAERVAGLFDVLDQRHRLYRANPVAHPTRAVPVMPLEGASKDMREVRARPGDTEREQGGHIIAFHQRVVKEETLRPEGQASRAAKTNEVVRRLELELRCLREQLREIVEQYEATIEEQEVSNEELQATNEELRSTTEELETSKEELQSINEELCILNQELKSKIEELSEANDDLVNLMSSTDIATIFLDRFLRIKRYTPRAVELFNFIKTDIGRPLFDIRHKLNYENLQFDAEEVINKLNSSEREVSSQEGRTYIARLVPYRTVKDQIDGVVLSFVDITDRRRSEEALRQAHVGLELRITERTQQQQAVADLSQNALAGSNLASLLNDAVAKVTESLRVEFCNVFEFIPNRNALLLCAGIGWREDRIGKTTVLPGYDSLAGFTLLSNSVVIVEDLRTESRFRASPLLLEHGIISSVSTIIRGRSRAFGVLGAHSPNLRKFSEDGIHFLQAIANVLATAVERRDLEKELVDISSRERLRIGQDLHDGLCQQLAGIQYSADLIAKKLPSDVGAKAEIVKVANRIREAIVQARNLARGLSLISLESHGFMSALEELAASAQGLFQIRCRFECKQPVLINDNTLATHLYRIAQEAIHNAVKHGHATNVLVALRNAEGNITLSIVDDGAGLMSDWPKKTGMGLRIMNYRAHIIGGTFSIERAKPKGTQVICSFRL